MKGKKCFGVLLALSIIFGLSLSAYLDVNAINNYNGSIDNFRINNTTNTTNQVSTTISSNNSFFALELFPNSTIDTSNYNRMRLFFSYSGTVGPFDQRGMVSACGFIGSNDNRVSVISSQYEPIVYNTVYPSNYFYDDNNRPSTIDSVEVGLCSYELVLDISKLDSFSSLKLHGDFLRVFYVDASSVYHPGGGNLNNSITLYMQSARYQLYNDDSATALEELNEKDEEDRNNLESQSSSTESSAESSSQDAENTGTTLLGAFSSFVTALTSASPSNCKLDMDLGNLDLGIVDLCQLSLPQPFPTIASIMLILFCVPLSVTTAIKANLAPIFT